MARGRHDFPKGRGKRFSDQNTVLYVQTPAQPFRPLHKSELGVTKDGAMKKGSD